MEHVTVKVKKLRPEAIVPRYHSVWAAGVDLHACSEARIYPGERRVIVVGLAIELPKGYEAQLRPRSGLAVKHGISIVNTPGTVDADFRGELGVCLINHGDQPFVVKPGDRIAQMVVKPVPMMHFMEVDELSETERGAGGLGSTGVSA